MLIETVDDLDGRVTQVLEYGVYARCAVARDKRMTNP